MCITDIRLMGLVLLFWGSLSVSYAQPPDKTEKTNGMTMVVMPADPQVNYGVALLSSDEALAKMKAVMALIHQKSSYSRREIARLVKTGNVILAYDPAYPKKGKDLAKVRIAGFSKDYELGISPGGKKRSYMAIVGRHGIKWPLEKLAAVVVHELVGHGVQHMEGRWNPKRQNDMECEAWLYESQAYADFGVGRLSSDMIKFQKQLSRYCNGFTRYLESSDPAGLKAWKVLNRDVPMILKHFRRYLES